jgi:hypothetical protein
MKRAGIGLILASGLVFGLGSVPASAAPISAAPIAQAAEAAGSGVEHVWYDRFGVWHPNRRAVIVAPPVYVAPPVVVAPRAPVCARTWVCGPRGCAWRTRCR